MNNRQTASIFSVLACFAFALALLPSFVQAETLSGDMSLVNVRTDAPQKINHTSWRLKGYVENNGPKQIYTYFEWGTTTDLGSKLILARQTQRGVVYADVQFFNPNTTYYYRTTVRTEDGIKHGNIESFTTGPSFSTTFCTFETYYNTLTGEIEKGCAEHGHVLDQNGFIDAGGNDTTSPEIDWVKVNARTDAPQRINPVSWRLKGYVGNDGTNPITSYFEWGATVDLGSAAVLAIQPQNGPIYATLNHLEPNTTYYYRTVVRTLFGVKYGNTESFTTPPSINLSTCTMGTVYNTVTGTLETGCREHYEQ